MAMPPAEPPRHLPQGAGLLLVGHGTRDRAGVTEFWELERKLRRLAGQTPIAGCFLELAEPDILTAVDQLLARGVRQLVVSPLLLFAAGHAKHDIPAAVEAALRDRHGVDVIQAGVLSCHPHLVELSTRRYFEAWRQAPLNFSKDDVARKTGQGAVDCPDMPPRTTLVLVGRGNRDAAAQNDLRRYADELASRLLNVLIEPCFYALAEPQLSATLARVIASAAEHVVVQPHLLFRGDVLNGIAQQAKHAAVSAPARQRWRMTAHLGAEDLLAEAIWDLALRAVSDVRASDA